MECTSLTHLYTKKGYVQRDYSRGTKIRFETTLPSELENFISQAEFSQFIEGLNEIYAESEKLKFCEGCLACLTAYLLYCCIETHKQKCMRKATEYIENQNDIWKDRGITATIAQSDRTKPPIIFESTVKFIDHMAAGIAACKYAQNLVTFTKHLQKLLSFTHRPVY